MVAIFTGLGAGFERGSAAALGAKGLLGSSSYGRGGEGVFLNAHTGSLLLSRQDEFLLGKGPDASVSRTYNSQGAFDDNGDYWRQSTDRRIYLYGAAANTVGSSAKRVSADGSEVTYTFNAAGSYYETMDGAGSYDRMTYNGATYKWTWIDSDTDISETYVWATAGHWRIETQTDADGNALTFAYDPTTSRLTTISTADGGYIKYTWNSANTHINRVEQFATSAGGTSYSNTFYDYENETTGRLIGVRVDLTLGDSSEALTYETEYEYDGTSNLITSIKQTDGSSLAIVYDVSGRVTSLTETVGPGDLRVTSIAYIDEGNGLQRTEVTDPRGQVTKLWTKNVDDSGTTRTDERAQLVRVMAPPAVASGTPTEVNYTYDANGNVLTAVTKAGGATLGTTSYLYDSWGNLATITDPTGRSVQRTYSNVNNRNLLVRESVGVGEYISQGAASLTSSALGNPASVGGLSGSWTITSGVAQTTLPSTGDFLGLGPKEVIAATVGRTYRVSVEIKVEGPYSYNAALGAPVTLGARMMNSSYAEVRATGVTASATNLGQGWFRLEYDVTVQSGEEFIRPFAYRRNSLTGTGTIAFRNLRVDNETRYVYDTPGNNLRFVVSPEGHVTESIYSGGLLKYTIAYTNDAYIVSSTTPLTESALATWASTRRAGTAKVTEYVYNERGAVTQVLSYGVADNTALSVSSLLAAQAPAAFKNEGFAAKYFVYDQSGRLLSTYDSAGSSSVAQTISYDGLGRVTASTSGAGGQTTIVFDDENTTTTVTTQTSSGVATASSYTVVSTYNKAGELIGAVDSGSSLGGSFTNGGTTTHVYNKNGQLRLTTDPTGRRHFYVYDLAGRKTLEVLSDSSATATGAVTEYRYDAEGRVVATRNFYNTFTTAQLADFANPANEVITTARPTSSSYDIWQWTVYDTAGRIIETVLGDGSVTQYAYDNAGRLVKTIGYYNKLSSGIVAGYRASSPTAISSPTLSATDDVVLRTFYDRDGRVIGALNGEGYLSHVIYDEAGQKIQDIAYANETHASVRVDGTFEQLLGSLSVDVERDVSTRYVYDGQGLLRYTIDPLKRVTELLYHGTTTGNATGLVRKAVAYATPLGTVANYLYATIKSAVSNLVSPQNNRIAWSIYNTRGQLVYAINQTHTNLQEGIHRPIATVTRYAYDADGRVIKTTQYAEAIDMHGRSADAAAEYDAWAADHDVDARITRNYYAERGELRYVVDAEGYVVQNIYDTVGRLGGVYRYSASIATTDSTTIANVQAANKGTFAYTQSNYDYAGRLMQTIDANGVRDYFLYHATGKLAQSTRSYAQPGTDDDSRVSYVYDQAGRLVRKINYVSEAAIAGIVGTNATLVTQGWRLRSANTEYSAVLTREGELRIYHKGEAIWSSGISEAITNATYRLVAQNDGKLVIHRDVAGEAPDAIWSSTATGYSGATYLVMQDNGNLELRKGTPSSDLGLLWSSGTTSVVGSNYATMEVDATYSYDGLGNLQTFTDAKGQATNYDYDRVGRVKQEVQANGTKIDYDYDAFGGGVRVSGSYNGATPDRYSYKYHDQLGRVVLTVDAEDYAVRTDYTAFGDIEKVTRYYNKATGTGSLTSPPTIIVNSQKDAVTTFTYDKLGRLKTTTGAEGAVETFVYDAFGQRTHATNSLGGETTYLYDKLGRVTQETLPVSSFNADGTEQPEDVVNTYTYDARGNLTQKIEALALNEQRITNYQYDATDRLVLVSHEAISVTNSVGETSIITPETRTVYDRRDNVIETVDAAGARTLFWYDDVDRLTHQLSATGTISRFFYDKNGNVAESRVYNTAIALPADAKGMPPVGSGAYRVTRYAYDQLDRLTETIIPAIDVATVDGGVLTVETDDLRTINEYDATGNVVKTTDANGKSTWFYYDKVGNLKTQIDALNYRTEWTHDADGNVLTERRFYTASTPPTVVTAPPSAPATTAKDQVTTFRYDKAGRKVLTVDSENYVVATAYNGLNQITSVTRYAAQVTWSGGNPVVPTLAPAVDAVTSMTYDVLGRLTGTQDALLATETFKLNAFGEQVRVTNKLGGVTEYTYDKLGRLIEEKLPVGSHNANGTKRLGNIANAYLYDAVGNRTQMIEAAGLTEERVTNYEYDLNGRLLRTYGEQVYVLSSSTDNVLELETPEQLSIYDAHGAVIETIDAAGARTLFWYDKAGRLTHQVDATGALKRYFHDRNGNALEVRTFDTPVALPTDATGAPPSGSSNSRVVRYAYDSLNRVISAGTPSVETAVYDEGLLEVATEEAFSTTVYDGLGNVERTIDANGVTTWFYYDTVGRQKHKIDGANYRTDWTHDADGNVVFERRWSTASTPPTLPNGMVSPPAAPSTSADDRVTTFTYDKMGRRLTETRRDVLVHDGNGGQVAWDSTIIYTYNALGQVVTKTEAPSIPSLAAWWNNGNTSIALRYDTTAQGEDAIFLRQDAPYIYSGARYGGSVIALAGDRPDGRYTVQPGQTVKYSFDVREISDTALRTDAALAFFDASGAFLGHAGSTWTEANSGFVGVDGSATAPAGAAYATLEIWVLRPGTSNAAPIEIAIRNLNVENSGATLPTAISSWNNLELRYDQTVQGEKALFLRQDVPLTHPEWPTWQHGGAILATNGDRADGLHTVRPGQAVSYSFDTREITGTDLRTDAFLTFWDASGVYIDRLATTYTEANSGFVTASGSASAPANAAYMGLEVILTRLNTTNTGPMEIAIRNVRIDIDGANDRLGKTLGDTVKYVYDQGGRLIREVRSAYTDVDGLTVNPTVDYYYNGLSDLTRMRQRGSSNAAERVTSYAYDNSGRLETMTDAGSFERDYFYDKAGRVVREEYNRIALSSTADEAVGTDYDILGRVVTTGAMKKAGGNWTRAGLDRVSTQYNAFGEVSARGMNDVLAETFSYDEAGRLWRTTSGDGTWKYFMYDRAGNQTLAVASDGTDISNISSMSAVRTLWGGNIATTYQDGIVATITRYDGRNMAVEVFEPQRELNSTTRQSLQTQRAYNAFGETRYEINALGAQVDYAYNTMGRLIKSESPQVAVTSETGAVTNVRPTEHRYYDTSGRLVASRDANGNLTRLTVLAGTGHGGNQALVTAVRTADNAVVATAYDIHGDARRVTDQIGRVTGQTFDAMGRLTQTDRPGGLIETFEYDGLGQRTRTYNNLLGSGNAETNTYDAQGRLIQQISAGGDTTSFSYTWSGSLATNGLGTFGGWTQVTTYANTKTLTEQTDQFGRTISRTDLGGNTSASTYDKAGRIVLQDGGVNLNLTYFNTGRLATSWSLEGVTTSDDWLLRTQTNGYDAVGNLVSQRYELEGEDAYYNAEYWVWVGQGPKPQLPPLMDPENPEYGWEYHPAESGVAIIDTVQQDATATYDALGRLTGWYEAGANTPAASTTYKYDAQGNIRHTSSSFYELNSAGGTSGSPVTRNNWYRFDALNRVVTSEGVFQGTPGSGSIVRGSQGMDIFYDNAGQRAYSLRTNASSVITREDYGYDADGRMTEVRSGANASAAGVIVGRYHYDALGRLAWQKDYTGSGYQGSESGTNLVYHRTNTWNEKSQVTTDVAITKRGSDTYQATSSYVYDQGSSATYALGSPLKITTQNWTNGSPQATSETTNTYAWYDGAVTSSVQYKLDVTQSATQTTPYAYEIIGGRAQLVSVTNPSVPLLQQKTVRYFNDLSGQALMRWTEDYVAGSPVERFYRFGGKEMGHITNNGTLETSYNVSIADRTAVQPSSPGPFHNGATSGTSHGAFAEGVDPITTYEQGSASGTYTVRGGETLAGIAANLWGDAALWYKLAEANGLAGQSALIAGQQLRIPAGVMRSTHNAATFKPYDPAQALGELGPATPKPPNKKNCGAMGAILMTVIAVVVTAWIAPHAIAAVANMLAPAGATAVTASAVAAGTAAVSTTASIAGGAIAGAAGSIASQTFGVATGIQDRFSWNAVALAAIGGGVGGVGNFGISGSELWQVGARAMVSSAVGQGIGVVTGLQSKFSWTAVAAAGVSAAATSNINTNALANRFGGGDVGGLLAHGVSGGASAIANAATRSLIDGTDFGDNIIAALPDVIGNAIGSMLTDRMRGATEARDAARMTAAEEASGPVHAGRHDRQGGIGGAAKAMSAAAQDIALDYIPSNLSSINELALDIALPEGPYSYTETVGEKGSFWTIAERTLPGGASDTEIRARTLVLMAANRDLDPMRLRADDVVTVPGGTIAVTSEDYARYTAADARYQTVMAERAAISAAASQTPAADWLWQAIQNDPSQWVPGMPIPNSRVGDNLADYVPMIDYLASRQPRISSNNGSADSAFWEPVMAFGGAVAAVRLALFGGGGNAIASTTNYVRNPANWAPMGEAAVVFTEGGAAYAPITGLVSAGGVIAVRSGILDDGFRVIDELGSKASGLGAAERGLAEVGVPATRSSNPLSQVLDFDAHGNEIFYRSMSPADYARMQRTGAIPATGETFVSPSQAYSAGYDGVLVRVTTAPGTAQQLSEIGVVANPGTANLFPGMPVAAKGWTANNAMLKLEGNVVNTGLGRGSALTTFNKNIVKFEQLPK